MKEYKGIMKEAHHQVDWLNRMENNEIESKIMMKHEDHYLTRSGENGYMVNEINVVKYIIIIVTSWF